MIIITVFCTLFVYKNAVGGNFEHSRPCRYDSPWIFINFAPSSQFSKMEISKTYYMPIVLYGSPKTKFSKTLKNVLYAHRTIW